MTVYADHGHLGGYIPGGDALTWCPALWQYMIDVERAEYVLDIGCGEGHSLRYFNEHGCVAVGIEGVPQNDPNIIQHDYTKGPFDARNMLPGDHGAFDLAWCCEFVEHVEEQYVSNFLATLKDAWVVLLTHATPGQEGYHHVNCRTDDYWKGAFNVVGFDFDYDTTVLTRQLVREETHYARTGLVFRRR